MIKDNIGVLDMSFEGINVLESLTKNLKFENIIYINDYENQPYEGLEINAILEFVKKKVDFLLELGIKLLVVISDTIVEYAMEYLETLSVPVINIVDSLINYTNEKYEQKNIILLAKLEILDANIYQKNFKYNHLYSIACNGLNNCIENKETKTKKSFNIAKDIFKQVYKRDIDVIVPSSPYLGYVKTEIGEYIHGAELVNVSEVIANNVIEYLKENNLTKLKKKGKVYIYSYMKKKDYFANCSWFKIKCKYIQIK